jgi:hypothetical protein
LKEELNSRMKLEDDSLATTWAMGLLLHFSTHSHLDYWICYSPIRPMHCRLEASSREPGAAIAREQLPTPILLETHAILCS